MKVMNIRFITVSKLIVFAAFVLCLARISDAQQAAATSDAASVPSVSSPAASAAKAEEGYRIGPGDVLEIRFYKRPELSRDNVSVSANGTITMPMVDGEIQAACLTETELANELAQHYQKYFRSPHLDVFIKDYKSQQVAVLGAVNHPARFQLQRRVRLLRLLAEVDGLKDKAGRSINVIHDPPSFNCSKSQAVEGVSVYRVRDLMSGDPKSNPYLTAGDIVFVPDADEAYIVGNVQKPTNILLREQITLSTAIAMAGGVLPASKLDKIKLVRVNDKGEKDTTYYDLNAIQKKQKPDVVLQPGDIVEVGTSPTKVFLRGFLGASSGTLATVPLRPL